MKTGISLIFSLVLLTSQQVFAHGSHGHEPVTEEQVLSRAAVAAKRLSLKDVGLEIGKLPTSWASITKEHVSMYKKGEGYYIVAVMNSGEKKTLYILMSSDGGAYDANFTGAFEGVE